MSMKMLLAAAAFLAAPALAQSSAPIDPARMSAIVKELASDPYQGRAPGTPGEDRTIAYLVAQVKALGLEPAGDPSDGTGGWTQAVPLIHTKLGAVTISTGIPWTQGRQVYVGTARPVDRVAIAAVPMVFVGYGISAPERGWDDFKGVDLKGKVAIFLINDPDFEAAPGEPVAGKFGGRTETYYGRWTYKYEEAGRRGAIGALIIHDTPGAGYGWETVNAGGGENYDTIHAPSDLPRVLLQGWIEGAAAQDLMTRAGLDLAKLRVAARRADFRPVPLSGITFSADAAVATERVVSRNVVARLTGKAHPGEAVMFGAHWDAYGIGAPDSAGRVIRPGAADDAIGVAGVLEIARAFKAAPRTDRTVLFGLWTGEERYLLGSETYAAHPDIPLAKTVANLTMDVLQTAGPAHDVILVGNGQSDLDDRLAAAAAKQGRTVTAEALPERGLYFRADHFSVARRGVPALLLMGMSGGHDLVAGGRAAGDAWLTDYMKCYHQTCDSWSPSWDLRGAAQDVALLYAVGRDLADSRAWPQWRPTSEFKALRDASAASRR